MGNFIVCCSEERKVPGEETDDTTAQKQYDNQGIQLYYGNVQRQQFPPAEQSDRNNLKKNQNFSMDDESHIKNESRADLVVDNLSKYEFQGELTYEVEEIAKFRNDQESDIEFSKRGIMDYINFMFQKENSDDERDKWDRKLQKDNVEVFIKKGGSQLNKDHPFLKATILFNSYYNMEKLIEVISDDDHRLKFDKNFSKFETLQVINNNCSLCYSIQKGALNMNNKDFVDKVIRFSDNGVYYGYSSFVPNDLEYKGPLAKADRGKTLIKLTKIERRPSDGKIVFQMMFQSDLVMMLTPKIISMFMPGAVHTWSKNCVKYINDNYDTI